MLNRRDFLKKSAGAAALAGFTPRLEAAPESFRFPQGDSLFHGPEWESLNPGFWQIRDGALRRRLSNVGDRARRTGFPFHSATNGQVMEMDYDPSLPPGILYRRDTWLSGEYTIEAEFTYHADRTGPDEGDDSTWKMFENGYGLMGLAFGSKNLFESYTSVRNAVQVGWTDDDMFRFLTTKSARPKGTQPDDKTMDKAWKLKPGDAVDLTMKVSAADGGRMRVEATMTSGDQTAKVHQMLPKRSTEGYFGITGRGLIDFSVTSLSVEGEDIRSEEAPALDCYACYPLGDTLRQEDGNWQVRFVALFDDDGEQVELRIAESENPDGGWKSVPVAGQAPVVNHEWRRNTAVIEATLPQNPSEATLYYTVWKDGVNVTSDPRIGSASVGPGTGLVGDVPADGGYVGRLPQLTAPYKMCGLSCHAITSGLQHRTETGWQMLGGGDVWRFRDQPSQESYKHLEDYNFQIMVWEDDVWYMELVLYPPSTDDAYQVVKHSICGPTSRWQMMRHWNVINPGDHDYGMDDVKGPEQLAIRRLENLGQDAEYMRRNFQIVHHLITGEEEVDPLANPKKWRAWKMPKGDFTFLIVDSRLWRTSQDVDIWDDAGWGHEESIYDRKDPTRTLLGEEQFSWLERTLTTDTAPLICLTGLNGLHTIWTGVKNRDGGSPFDQRDRVTADYAGWVKAGADRVIELLGAREGIVTVYGDVHNGCIMKNQEHRVIECSFGPIGRSGGRAVIPGFGPTMKDWDGRPLEVHALYHREHATPDLQGHGENEPFYWNFLEMEFDPREVDGRIGLRVRNLVDPPTEAPRGGGQLETVASETGRPPRSKLEPFTTLPDADVRFSLTDGTPLRGMRSRADGLVSFPGFPEVEPGMQILATIFDGEKSEALVLETLPGVV